MMARLPPEKPLGEFMELQSNYQGSYRPARMALRKTLDADRMRNPLLMSQSASSSSRRPVSSPGSRPTSAARLAASGSLTARSGKDADKATLPASGGIPGSPQAADRGPGILQPQRIELPSFLNTPARRPDAEPLRPEDKIKATKKIQDLDLLTFACKRASKLREEGRVHFSVGVLRDNLKQYRKAIDSYSQFLRICKECNDAQGCALAYHCIAVDHQLLGSTSTVAEPNEAGSTGTKPEIIKKAIFFHNKHRENSDAVGKFVAHLNMGLAYAQLGEREAATVNHQYALRYALQLHSLEGQSLAIGSLSFSAGMYENDPAKMRILIQRYVEICGVLKQTRNQTAALKKLGLLAGQNGDLEESITYFQQAIDAAREQGDFEAEQECSVRLGIAAGQAKMDDHLRNILKLSAAEQPQLARSAA